MKVLVAVGPTGSGKSYLVKKYNVENKQPEIGSALESKTAQTTAYVANVGGEEVLMYDTPGLGDSEQRDQIFLDELVQTLQRNCTGIHKFYFLMAVTEPRYNNYLHICLSTILQLAPDIRQKPSVLTVVLTKADQGHEEYWGSASIPGKIANLKQIIQNRHNITPAIILHGNGNQEPFKQDVASVSLDVFSQTQFMRNVLTLDTQHRKAREELEAAKQQAEQEKKRIDELQVQYEAAVQASDAKAQSLADEIKQLKEQDSKKIDALQAAYDKAAKDSEGKTQLLTQQISDLRTQIANMPQPIHNHYHTDGDGGDSCVLL